MKRVYGTAGRLTAVRTAAPSAASAVIRSAGAVVWRPAAGEPGGIDVLLVHRSKYDDWSLPKGKREPGEHVLLTAVREVFEETSVRPVLGPQLRTTRYPVAGRPKQVEYWSACSPGNSAAASHEIDAVSWLPLPQARQLLSYARDADVIASLTPRPTVPLIVVRHASAGQKADWDGDDRLRPLDAGGEADALLLADLLRCFAPAARVISSPALRCTETMRPYTARSGGSVEVEAALAVPGRGPVSSAGRTVQDEAFQNLFRDLVADAQPAVVCLHRENLPRAIEAACAALGVPRPSIEPDPALPKGGFWVVHAAAGELAALERYEL
jgi:8-oxo-dGTP pyrophosphatase MutT (NUDIX family)/phosphohistidine phosphatase SixA